jgi:hypothetical protein
MSVPLPADDPARWMLYDGFTTTPTVYRSDCYICRDPEFAQMGLPLCHKCPSCADGHIPADDVVCTDCGYEYEPPVCGGTPIG